MHELNTPFPTEQDKIDFPLQAIVAGVHAILESKEIVEHEATTCSRSMVFIGLDGRDVVQNSSEVEMARQTITREVGLSAARAWMASNQVGAAAF